MCNEFKFQLAVFGWKNTQVFSSDASTKDLWVGVCTHKIFYGFLVFETKDFVLGFCVLANNGWADDNPCPKLIDFDSHVRRIQLLGEEMRLSKMELRKLWYSIVEKQKFFFLGSENFYIT